MATVCKIGPKEPGGASEWIPPGSDLCKGIGHRWQNDLFSAIFRRISD